MSIDERRWRLASACTIAKITKADVAKRLNVTGSALSQWERRGDGGRKNALTAAEIAAAISELGGVRCPPEALQAGSTFRPEWVDRPPS